MSSIIPPLTNATGAVPGGPRIHCHHDTFTVGCRDRGCFRICIPSHATTEAAPQRGPTGVGQELAVLHGGEGVPGLGLLRWAEALRI